MNDEILRIGQAGLDNADERVQALMENIVNARTPGYLKANVVSKSFPLELQTAMEKADSKQAMEPMLEGKFFNQLKGSLTPTKRDLDLAATNDGFFVISGPWGEGYTRDGRLQTDANGNLITVAGGYSILGKSGPIQITPGSKIAITQTGKILVNDIEIAQLRQVRIKDVNSLETLNGSVFKADAAVPVEEMESPQIVSGYLEAANVNVVESMMEMIYLNKIYNLNTTLVKSRDSNLTKALELGRLQ